MRGSSWGGWHSRYRIRLARPLPPIVAQALGVAPAECTCILWRKPDSFFSSRSTTIHIRVLSPSTRERSGTSSSYFDNLTILFSNGRPRNPVAIEVVARSADPPTPQPQHARSTPPRAKNPSRLPTRPTRSTSAAAARSAPPSISRIRSMYLIAPFVLDARR